ncbi:hypothetical protein D049_1251B, partial [Vibrio parahaemolyticus VPTS-2010]
TYAVTDSNEP